MLNSMKLSLAIAAVSLSFMGAANAAGNHDGGLMKEMMSSKYQIQPITDAAAQAHLHTVSLPSDQNGGLKTEMMPVEKNVTVTASQQTELDDLVIRGNS